MEDAFSGLFACSRAQIPGRAGGRIPGACWLTIRGIPSGARALTSMTAEVAGLLGRGMDGPLGMEIAGAAEGGRGVGAAAGTGCTGSGAAAASQGKGS